MSQQWWCFIAKGETRPQNVLHRQAKVTGFFIEQFRLEAERFRRFAAPAALPIGVYGWRSAASGLPRRAAVLRTAAPGPLVDFHLHQAPAYETTKGGAAQSMVASP